MSRRRLAFTFKRGALAWVSLLCALPAWGQQTIFNVPSAEVAGRGQWFYQHQSVARNWNPGRRWIQTNAFGYGVGRALELDASWCNLETSHLESPAPSLGFKWSPRLNSHDSVVPVRLVAGDMVQFHGHQPHYGNWAYLMLNGELPKSRTYLAGGVTQGSHVLFGSHIAAAIVSIEQHLSTRWMVQAEWTSGRHDLAYAIPGVVYHASHHWLVTLGYQIPNRKSPGFGAIVFELTRIP